MRLAWNFFAGLANSFCSVAVGLIATPFYLKYLGIESYGLIGFFTTLMTIAQMLDMGLSSAMNREVARQSAFSSDLLGVRHLLASLERIYWMVAIFLGGIFICLAHWLAMNWIHSKQLSELEVSHAIMLMGGVAMARWPVALYSGTLMGAQKIALVSSVSIVISIAGSAGAILFLAFVSPTIEVFFLWQAAVGFVNALFMRRLAWKELGRVPTRVEFSELKRVWRFSAGLSAVTVLGALLWQSDKILLSRIVELAAFGRYVIASIVAGGLYLLVTPVFNVLFPRFSALIAEKNEDLLKLEYQLYTRMLGTLVFPVAISVALFSEPLLRMWTHDDTLAAASAPILGLLILGSAFHGVMYVPYALQLAYGDTKLPFIINVALLSFYLPTVLVLGKVFGTLGAAAAWLLLHIFYVAIGSWLTHRRFLTSLQRSWLAFDVGVPLLASFTVWFCVEKTKVHFHMALSANYGFLIEMVVTAGTAMFLSLCFSPKLRKGLLVGLWARLVR